MAKIKEGLTVCLVTWRIEQLTMSIKSAYRPIVFTATNEKDAKEQLKNYKKRYPKDKFWLIKKTQTETHYD